MKRACSNIYQIARESAQDIKNQAEAAERIHTSPRSLSDYETGRTIPPDDIVCAMVKEYKAPWLGYEHLRNSTRVGQMCLPEIEFSDLPKTVLIFQKEEGDIKQVTRDMVEIACDGKVDSQEKPRWDHITKEIKELAGAALSVVYAAR